jgi:hypothetical protein
MLPRWAFTRPAPALSGRGATAKVAYCLPLPPRSENVETTRQAGPGLRILLVAMTGYGQEADRRLARGAGFDHHLVKPIYPDAVQAQLAPAPG